MVGLSPNPSAALANALPERQIAADNLGFSARRAPARSLSAARLCGPPRLIERRQLAVRAFLRSPAAGDTRTRPPTRPAAPTQAPAPQAVTPQPVTPAGEAYLKALPGPLYYLPSLLLPLTVVGAAEGAAAASADPALSVTASLSSCAYVFLLAPALDSLLGCDLRNPTPEEAAHSTHSPLYRAILHAYVPVHYAVLLYAAHTACTAHLHPLAALGLALSTGACGTVYFTVAHELLHGSRLDRFLSNVLLASTAYLHWTESHLVHHIKVATPQDPASACRGETLWAFLPRTVWGNVVDGYRAEAQRLTARGLPLLSLHNRMLWWVGAPLAMLAASFCAWGWAGVAFMVTQALLQIWCLETVNYIEHYGLRRKRLPGGRYERVAPRHSWDGAFLFTNGASFKLARHADHHTTARKPYQNLLHSPQAPQLPACYPALMVVAVFPPLWFRLMHPLLDAAEAGEREGESEGEREGAEAPGAA